MHGAAILAIEIEYVVDELCGLLRSPARRVVASGRQYSPKTFTAIDQTVGRQTVYARCSLRFSIYANPLLRPHLLSRTSFHRANG